MVNHSYPRSLLGSYRLRGKMGTKLVLLAILAISLFPHEALSQGFCGLCTPDCAVNLGAENRRLSFFNNSLYYLDTLTSTTTVANTTCTSLFSRPAWPGIPGNLAPIQSTEELNFVKIDMFYNREKLKQLSSGSGSVVTMDSFVCKIPCSDGIITRPKPAVHDTETNIYNINLSNSNNNELSFDDIFEHDHNEHSKDFEEHIVPGNTECKDESYKILDEETRSIIRGIGKMSDVNFSPRKSPAWDGPGWYRFVEPAGIKMPEKPTAPFRCGTQVTGWLDGSHPRHAGMTKNSKFCFSQGGSNCHLSTLGRVTNCGKFFVYKLPDAPNNGKIGDSRYCAQ